MAVSIGTSGFSLQSFYPPTVRSSEKLNYYASVFSTVEVNSTFYHLPRETTLIAWKQAVPSDFIFAFKVSQGVTHVSEGLFNRELLRTWFFTLELFATTTRDHVLLFQFPSSVTYDSHALASLLSFLPDTYLYAFEFRHPSWFIDHVYQLIREVQGTIVWADSPLRANNLPVWPKVDVDNTTYSYMRFHGSPTLYRSAYSSEQLREYAEVIRRKESSTNHVYVYFNNDAAAHAAANAQELCSILSLANGKDGPVGK